MAKQKLSINDIKKQGYVNQCDTKYNELPKKYFRLYYILKDSKKKWEWVDAMLGNKGNVTPKDLYELCRENPIAYVVFMKGCVPYPHQMVGLLMMKKYKYLAISIGRRLGKSYMIKWFCDWACRLNKYPVERTGTTFSIMMQNKENGKEVYMEKAYLEQMDGDLEVLKNFKGMLGDSFFSDALVKSSEKYGQVTGYKFTYNTLDDMSFDNYYKYLQADKKEKKKFRVVPSTFKIITSPRGLEGNVACDEISHWKKNPHLSKTTEVYEKEIEPIVTIQDSLKCFMLTTPDGYEDVFEEKFNPLDNHDTEFKRLWYPCWVHQTDQRYIDFMKKKKKTMAKNGKLTTFQQEYEAMFVRSSDGFFDEELHIERFFDDTIGFEPTSNEECYISVDWGGTNTSHTAISVVTIPEDNDSIATVKYFYEYRINEDARVVDDIIDMTHKFPNYRKVICDNKGGRFQVQQLQEMLGLHKVEAFNFTTQKMDGYNALKSLIVTNRIKCPESKRIREQMRNFLDTLKPANKQISDDVLDTIMMPCYYMKFDEDKTYDVLQYPDDEDEFRKSIVP